MVRTGGIVSKIFALFRGTHQGYPLLFALTMKPSAALLRRELGPWGTAVVNTMHVVSLYADDSLIYMAYLVALDSVMLYVLQTFR
ncbi:hypothetical protein NDU88_001889 [Pleurodeles waltl]|uniref:Uncharacterized protein n=1 Tax=Pleurodeles waltl TaxID=8319 RepID=A0AAV7TLH1_PLEWA|nr:hypothetical protein NDU88_001889 [Pleurodeles waltl]